MNHFTEDRRPVVLSVAFPYAVLGPKAVGGAEVLCTQIEAACASLGFASAVVAHEDSEWCGRLYPTRVPEGIITHALRAEVEASQQSNIDRALAENAVALIHMHGFDFDRYKIPDHVPVLVTLHLPPSWYPESIWSKPGNYHFVCVSESQRAACPEAVRQRVQVIPNGVALPDAALLRAEGRYALMLARICPEKNLHAGLDAARLAGVPVLLGGAVFPYEAHERYFAEQIEPRLTGAAKGHEARAPNGADRASARFLGSVSGHDKARLLSRAACLLLPSLAPETSSLVAMEALAFGVPVIGMAVGAVTEIVEEGRTGFLIVPGGNAVRDMARAIGRLPELHRDTCRAVAEERFPLSRMLESYEHLYRSLARPVVEPRSGLREADAGTYADGASVDEPVRREITFTEIDSDEELCALAPEWIEAWGCDPLASPFQHPAWLLPWWRQFGPDGQLHALALRDRANNCLAGFLPLYVYREPQSNNRQLMLLGAGTTDYLDGVWGSGGGPLALPALQYARSALGGWDRASLFQLRQGSCLLSAAARAPIEVEAAEPTAVIDVTQPLPAKIQLNRRRYRRLAERQGVISCTLASTKAEALAAFEELAILHTRRWEGRGESGVLSDHRVLAHHREAVPLLLQAGLLCMFHLRLDGTTMGVLYGLMDPSHAQERRLYLYLIGFEARLAALSPGTLLVYEAWQYAREHGFAKVDLLRGGEEYKHLWGAVQEPTFALRFTPSGS